KGSRALPRWRSGGRPQAGTSITTKKAKTEVFCTRVIDDKMCGSNDEVQVNKDGFLVCRSCRIEVTNNNLMKTATAISKAVEDESHLYIIRLCNGNLKIGISSKLGQRFKDL